MVKMDPEKAKDTIPDDFLIAIGRVSVRWNTLESMIEMVLIKLAGIGDGDSRGKIIFNHMSWPQRMDVLGALVESLVNEYPRLNGYNEEVVPLLKKAQAGRNKIMHGFFGMNGGPDVMILRATARGKLKFQMEKITVSEIDGVSKDIAIALAGVWNKFIGT